MYDYMPVFGPNMQLLYGQYSAKPIYFIIIFLYLF